MISCSEPDGTTNILGDDTEISKRATDLCFMTWNVSLGLGKNGDLSDAESAEAICERIIEENPDVLTLQEVWIELDELSECLEANGYSVVAGNDFSPWGIDPGEINFPWIGNISGFGALGQDGLLTVIRTDLLGNQDIEEITTFEEYIVDAGGLLGGNGSAVDEPADKGFLHTSLTLEDGCVIEFVNLHMDAGNESQDICARIFQLIQLNNFLEENTNGSVVIGGDFNINEFANREIPDDCSHILAGDQDEYGTLLELFDGTPTHLVTQAPTTLGPTSSGGLLDYHIVTNYNSDEISINSVDHVFDCEPIFVVKIIALNRAEETWYERSHRFSSRSEAEIFSVEKTSELKSEGYNMVNTGIYTILDCEENVEDFSDHVPVRTCLTYECRGGLSNDKSEESDYDDGGE